MTWEAWRKSIDAHVRDRGVWVGLLDENWEPVATLAPRDLNEKHLRLSAPEVSFDHEGSVGGRPSIMVNELIAPDLGQFDEQGRFEASNVIGRSVCVKRPGPRGRQAYFIPYVDASGASAPESVHVEGAGLLSLLDATPCPSVPESWRGGFSVRDANAAGAYKTPREYSLVELASRADGYTVVAPAELAIRTVVQDSLDALQRHMGWVNPHMVVDYALTGRESPESAIRVEDDFILSTVAETARTAGVGISADLWWPGDDPVVVRVSPQDKELTELRVWDHPIAVIRVEQMEVSEDV